MKGLGCLGFLAAGALSFAAAWGIGARMTTNVGDGAPVRVVVATRDVVEDKDIDGTDLAELPLAARFTHPAMIPSEAAPRLVGLKVAATLEGTVLTWSHFADRVRSARARACTEAVGQVLEPAVSEAREAVLAEVRPEPPRESPVPRGEVLVLARAVKPGVPLIDADLTTTTVPPELLTASWIDASRRAEVLGASVVTALEPGEPLWWQMLDSGQAPANLGSCLVRVLEAEKRARERLAPSAAQAWVERESKSW